MSSECTDYNSIFRWAEKLPREDLESVEAEVAYLYRRESGQCPSYQNEIHFHAKNHYHRESAKAILKEFYKEKRRGAGKVFSG